MISGILSKRVVKVRMIQFDLGQCSAIGTREDQQDALLLLEDGNCVLAAVCDGMGGLHEGGHAANTAVMTLEKLYRQKPREQSMNDFYMAVVDILDESVFGLRQTAVNRQPSGTTIVSVGICGNLMHWLSVGDSRLYIVRDKEIVCATTDHNYMLLLRNSVKAGEISPEEYSQENEKGDALVSYIGMGGVDLMDCNKAPFVLQGQDVVILTSDGLYRCVSDEEIRCVASRGEKAQKIADQLVELAGMNSVYAQDNTTVIVIKYWGDKEHETDKM